MDTKEPADKAQENDAQGSGGKAELYLHAVIVKKPMILAMARKRAQEFIKNKAIRFYRETPDSFRFRNIPKGHFKDFRTKKINSEVSIVLGHLNE